ncbi:protein CUSTOS isoform X2 [Tamandua tetradactyla]|uniref:protein CUSTOS isoform X2 n=1 Tax=Tamandua tetradactyla TaxID=48850 RepID=UPI0040548060
MAAPSGVVGDSESSSSSTDEEELARCREASIPAWGLKQRPRGLEVPRADTGTNQLPATQPSLRYKVNEHEQDGNELQTTPEFRAHIAKKLGALLDSSITISEVEKKPIKAKAQKTLSEDDGFRLFFTSIPEGSKKEASPQPCRKRLPSSSSEDSNEEWKRCQEAAVSASDILQESAIHSPVEMIKEEKKEKKKQKKKARKEASAASAIATTTDQAIIRGQEGEAAKLNGDQMSLGTKKKRKKKAKKTSEASPFLPTKSAAAVPVN